MKRSGIILGSLFFLLIAGPVGAQYDYSSPAPPPAPYATMLSGTQLDQMLGPIALYPDPLIAQIFPAATQPSQIAVAANYVASGGDPNLIDQQPWDSSVKAVARFPDVIQMLDGNMEWTTELGQAFLNQPTDVMNSIQRLRVQAQSMGNLQTTPQETIVTDDGSIEILPANPEIIYVPQYDPTVVYYQRPYYNLISFGVGFSVGLWFNHDWDWHDHRVVVWGHDHPRPHDWWRERPEMRRRDFESHAAAWRPPEHRDTPRRVIPPMNRGDRGYAPRPARIEQPHEAPRPTRVEPPHEAPRPVQPPRTVVPAPTRVEPPHAQPPRVEPQHETPRPPVHLDAPKPVPAPAPAPRLPAPVHVAPAALARPAPSAFSGVQSAPATRAASSRGGESRQSAGPAAHPSGGGGGGAGDKKH